MLEWLQELFDLLQNGSFKGNQKDLSEIGKCLAVDDTQLITVAARTPQRSSLKLFRLKYPTIASRAELGSISKVPSDILDKIYSEFYHPLL